MTTNKFGIDETVLIDGKHKVKITRVTLEGNFVSYHATGETTGYWSYVDQGRVSAFDPSKEKKFKKGDDVTVFMSNGKVGTPGTIVSVVSTGYEVKINDDIGGSIVLDAYKVSEPSKFKVGDTVLARTGTGKHQIAIVHAILRDKLYTVKDVQGRKHSRSYSESELKPYNTIKWSDPEMLWQVGKSYKNLSLKDLKYIPVGSVFQVSPKAADTILVADIAGHRMFIEPDGIQISLAEAHRLLNHGRSWELIHLG